MGVIDFLTNRNKPASTGSVEGATTQSKDYDIFKAYIPNFLYKPPYGMPRRDNTPQMKKLSSNPYVFSIIKTLCDEATSIDWKIKVKEEFMEDEGSEEYEDKINEITKFFKNPNGNEESFNHIMRQLVTDILEVDAGVMVKVFNVAGEFKQIFARDGSLFLKNPDIYGYIGNRRDFVSPLPDGFSGVAIDVGGTPTESQQQIMKQYSMLYKEDAAYFQYGWTAGSMPVPFGKREIVYMMQNPRADSIYGRSPVSILMNVILNLVYGVDFNLDYYTNNNMPDGAIQLLGAETAQIKQFKENFENKFKFTDDFGKTRKIFNKVPVSNTEVKFTPFQFNSKEMEVIAQQQWFTKVLWMAFGVNADEMGFTEDSNKTDGINQTKTFKRKALGPLLKVIQYHLNSQVIPEFFSKVGQEMKDFGEVPLEFEFDMYDIDEDVKELNKLQLELNMGIKTAEMVAKERGINIDELKEKKEEAMELAIENNKKIGIDNPVDDDKASQEAPREEKKEDKEKKVEEKASPISEINSYIDEVGNTIVNTLEDIDDKQLGY